MRGYNKVTLMGNLTKDPEVRSTSSGKSVISATVAINSGKDKDGNDRPPEFVNIVAWEKTADAFANYTEKGSAVLVDGRIQTRKWEDKEGNTRYSTEVVVSQMVIVKGKAREDAPAKPQGGSDEPLMPDGPDW